LVKYKIQRVKSRINDIFGEKTAVLSIIGLAYSAVQGFGGLEKLGDTISKGSFNSGTANTLIVFGLALLLGLSLGALALKNIANHLKYILLEKLNQGSSLYLHEFDILKKYYGDTPIILWRQYRKSERG
jgi:hypothetical protein